MTADGSSMLADVRWFYVVGGLALVVGTALLGVLFANRLSGTLPALGLLVPGALAGGLLLAGGLTTTVTVGAWTVHWTRLVAAGEAILGLEMLAYAGAFLLRSPEASTQTVGVMVALSGVVVIAFGVRSVLAHSTAESVV